MHLCDLCANVVTDEAQHSCKGKQADDVHQVQHQVGSRAPLRLKGAACVFRSSGNGNGNSNGSGNGNGSIGCGMHSGK